ncbi:MAG: glycosyltransferase family 2 protein [Kiritimatiellae bacterium]|nr:glycosyltransferase family 2 protein [Kiritimatiellia bacterium]
MTPAPPPTLWFATLAFNEEENIGRLLDNLAGLAPTGYAPRVLLVNDGSTDRTRETALSRADRLPVEVVDHPRNLGVGQGFRTAFDAALARGREGDVIVTLEADNTSALEVLPAMLDQLRAGSDVALASCYAPGGGIKGTTPLRMALSKTANWIIRTVYRVSEVNTYSSFYRAYRYRALEAATRTYGDRLIEEPGFVCMVELLVKLHRMGLKITEVPMVLDGAQRKGASKMKIARTLKGYARFALRDLFRRRKPR